MELTSAILTACAAAAVLAGVPAVASTGAPQSCLAGAPGAASDFNVQGEANHLFRDIQYDSRNARTYADHMVTVDTFDDLHWPIEAHQLTAIRHDVNDMGRKLCRLQSMERSLAPIQRQEIGRIAAILPLMADNTADAIHFLNARQSDFWMPRYRRYAQNLYSETRAVVRSSDRAVAYDHAARKLGRTAS